MGKRRHPRPLRTILYNNDKRVFNQKIYMFFFLVCLGYAPPPFKASSRIFAFGLIIRDIHTLTYYIAFRRDMALGWMCGLKPDGFISSVLGLYICVFFCGTVLYLSCFAVYPTTFDSKCWPYYWPSFFCSVCLSVRPSLPYGFVASQRFLHTVDDGLWLII